MTRAEAELFESLYRYYVLGNIIFISSFLTHQVLEMIRPIDPFGGVGGRNQKAQNRFYSIFCKFLHSLLIQLHKITGRSRVTNDWALSMLKLINLSGG